MILIILIILAYLFLYFNPSLDQTNKGEWIVWYTYKNNTGIGVFKKERRYFFLKQLNPFI